MRTRFRAAIVAAPIAMALLAMPSAHAQSAPAAVAEENFTVRLGDGWVSQAKMTYPAGQAGPFPTVIIIYRGDMDFSFPADAGVGPGVEYFKDLAESLSSRGIAVVRYHSRYVTGVDDRFSDKSLALTMLDHASDAERVIDKVRRMRRVDPRRIFIYGWSYSSQIVAYMASRRPDLAGVIMQGATASTETQVGIEDYLDNTLPYLRQFAPDGRITPEVLQQAQEGDATFAKFSAAALQDPASLDTVKVNPLLDINGDGVLEIDAEVIPNLERLVATGDQTFSQLPSVAGQAANVRIPVLVLHGEADTAVRVRNVRGLDQAFAGNPDYTLKVYPGLGHALYPVPSRFADLPGPMDAQPKADFAAWVLARSANVPSALPRTGGVEQPAWLALLALLALGVGWRLSA